MGKTVADILESGHVSASAPCRVDLGGTLDLKTFHYPLRRFAPCTFNIAIDLRTSVRIRAYEPRKIKISSKGFETAVFDKDKLRYDHPLGLMFAVVSYFDIDGIEIRIDSSSPPRSALGGSSVAAVALCAALMDVALRLDKDVPPSGKIPEIAHALEEGVAGVACGMQDQLAAAFGGVHLWNWIADPSKPAYNAFEVIPADRYSFLEDSMLLAYCGIPHVSSKINTLWVRQFLSGEHKDSWEKIACITREFSEAIGRFDMDAAARLMNEETRLRLGMTPDVLDDIGLELFAAAGQAGCGARFCGAGGGGCVWAVGSPERISALRSEWEGILTRRPGAGLLDFRIARTGVTLDPM